MAAPNMPPHARRLGEKRTDTIPTQLLPFPMSFGTACAFVCAATVLLCVRSSAQAQNRDPGYSSAKFQSGSTSEKTSPGKAGASDTSNNRDSSVGDSSRTDREGSSDAGIGALCCGRGCCASLVALLVLGVLFAKPGRCSICENVLKRTYYQWTIGGKKAYLCPYCNRRMEARQSRRGGRRRGLW